MTFNQDPPVVTMNPAMGDPACVRVWGTIPTARNPDVAAAVPAVVAVDPDVLAAGTGTASFNDGSGRSNADHNLRKSGGRQQGDCEQQSQYEFLHGF
jgi:hypothetical protein